MELHETMTDLNRRCFLARVTGLAVGAALAAAGPLPALAQALSLDEAAKQVQQDTGGRVLSARTVRGDDGPRYRFKVLLPGGRVRVIFVDAGGD